jgi:hypothetical protein
MFSGEEVAAKKNLTPNLPIFGTGFLQRRGNSEIKAKR